MRQVEDLAEALHVSRQTVSGWETGRTEPDIESLTAMSEHLQVDLTSLIQGATKKSYRTMQKKYVVWSVLLGVIGLGGIAACRLWLRPWLIQYVAQKYDVIPSFIYMTGIVPLCLAAAGAFIPCILSLWLDLRIGKYRNLVPLILGFAALIPTFATALQFVVYGLQTSRPSELKLWFPFVILPYRLLCTVIFPFIGGAGLFLGINSIKAKTE